MKLLEKISRMVLLGGLTSGVAACGGCEGAHGGAVGFPSDTLKCKKASDCGGEALDLACTAYPSTKVCDLNYKDTNGYGRCVIKTVNQCAQNDTRGVLLADNRTGVVECETANNKCDWGTAKPCGNDGEACCAGGCNGNLKCSSVAGGVGTVCRSQP